MHPTEWLEEQIELAFVTLMDAGAAYDEISVISETGSLSTSVMLRDKVVWWAKEQPGGGLESRWIY